MGEIDEFAASIRAWTDRQLSAYVDALSTREIEFPAGNKEVNDAVCGTVVLRPLEIVVLDSPLLQRLRHIRQLGVVHLVYPTATHTRLDHSIGTVHQVSRLVAGINAAATDDRPLIGPDLQRILRLTALCHDVGHGVMSHVSENALLRHRTTRRLMTAFTKQHGIERRKPSELAAYWMLDSPSFRRLIKVVAAAYPSETLPTDPVEFMRSAIVGQAVDNRIPLLHELISGPFDADKLDYMTRDAQMTGVPIVTDIPRLVRKVRGLELSPEELPPDIRSAVRRGPPTYTMTGISLSGGRTLDELMVGQTLLFDKLYRHHKVRAAEAMVGALMQHLAPLCAGGELMAPYELVDGELFSLDRSTVERLARRPLPVDDHGIHVAIDLASRLFDRRLFKRALAFANNMPLDPYGSDREQFQGLNALISDVQREQTNRDLVAEIADEATRAAELLGRTDALEALPGGDLASYVMLDPPNARTQSNESARAYLISDPGAPRRVLRFVDDYAETTGWSNAYLMTRDIGYVFTVAELRRPVFLAAEKVLRRRYAVRIPEAMLIYAKHERTELMDDRRILDRGGFYAGLPYDVRPRPERFENVDYIERLDRVVSNLHGYQGPVRDSQTDKKATLMSRARVETWISQFDSTFADVALTIAENLLLVGRPAVVRAVRSFVRASDPVFHQASLSQLGEPKDSSSFTTYFAADSGMTPRSLPSALAARGPIVFAEDFVGRGSQTISIFEALLGREPTQALHEERGNPLPPQMQELLQSVPIGIVYAAGRRSGASTVRSTLTEMGLDVTVHLQDERAPVLFEHATPAFVERCREIGRQLLADGDPAHDDDWIVERTLGYGNDGLLVTFPYNTPTQALTCLWKDGVVDGAPWLPLTPRRPKR